MKTTVIFGKSFFICDCQECDGTGTQTINNSWDDHPSRDEQYTCESCQGKGTYIDTDELEDQIEYIEDMIEGMINRIRITSDTVKSCNRGMLDQLEAKYRNQLHTQARGLARLETYCANLKTFRS